MRAKDLMRKHVVTVTPDLTLKEVARLFSDRHITGAPVVSRKGNLVGGVSQTDLVRHERESGPARPGRFQAEEEGFRAVGFHVEDPDYTRVEQVMTPWAVSFEEETPLLELARQMLNRHIHRVVITRDGKLVGILTSMDMLRALLTLAGDREPTSKA